MNSSPVAIRVRTPLPSPRHAASSPSSNPRSPLLQRGRRNLSTNHLIGTSLLVRMILSCALSFFIVSQWMFHVNYDDPASLAHVRNNSDAQHSHLNRVDSAAEGTQYPFLFVKNSSQPLSVAWLAARYGADADSSTSTTAMTWLDDALDRSKYIQLTQRIVYSTDTRNVTIYNLEGEAEPLVYIVEWASLQRDCHVLRAIVDYVLKGAKGIQTNASLFYYDSSHSDRVIQCSEVDRRFSAVKYAKQNLIRGRHWNYTKRWIEPGSLDAQFIDKTGTTIYAPPTLNQEFVTRLQKVLATRGQRNVFTRKRRVDVGILARYGSHAGYTFFRSHVMSAVIHKSGDKKAPYSVRALGDPTDLATNGTMVNGMLDSKIVVVAHPDEWQDSVGILEAMASGALVFCDNLLQVPGGGFENGTNIIFYESVEGLRSLLTFYVKHESQRLSIAKKGWEFALGTRRAWQGLESVLFGSPATHAGQPEMRAPSRRHM